MLHLCTCIVVHASCGGAHQLTYPGHAQYLHHHRRVSMFLQCMLARCLCIAANPMRCLPVAGVTLRCLCIASDRIRPMHFGNHSLQCMCLGGDILQ